MVHYRYEHFYYIVNDLLIWFDPHNSNIGNINGIVSGFISFLYTRIEIDMLLMCWGRLRTPFCWNLLILRGANDFQGGMISACRDWSLMPETGSGGQRQTGNVKGPMWSPGVASTGTVQPGGVALICCRYSPDLPCLYLIWLIWMWIAILALGLGWDMTE